MSIAVITGASGLVGSEAVTYFASLGFDVIGIDNGMREVFFGESASTRWMTEKLKTELRCYTHYDIDIRDAPAIDHLFARYSADIELIIHTAAQPSHDWAATDPATDFTVNANGTSVLLKQHEIMLPRQCSFLCRRTRFMEIAPISCPSWNSIRAGISTLGINTPAEFRRPCPSTERCIVFLVYQKSLRMCWFKNTDATLACGPHASGVDV